MTTKPFVKWVGGKRGIVKELKSKLPKHTRYVECMVGGGALYFTMWKRLVNREVILNDSNKALMETYKAIRDNPEEVIDGLNEITPEYRHDAKNVYYTIRDEFNENPSPAKLIFLNKTGFNGLYRVNAKGEFNVPWGQRTTATICDAQNIMRCSQALQGVKLLNEDVLNIIDDSMKGDLLYIDPPYYGSYRGYTVTKDILEHEFHHNLKSQAQKAVIERGVHVMISNSFITEVTDLYSSAIWRKHIINARRSVSRNASQRVPEPEYLITSYGER